MEYKAQGEDFFHLFQENKFSHGAGNRSAQKKIKTIREQTGKLSHTRFCP